MAASDSGFRPTGTSLKQAIHLFCAFLFGLGLTIFFEGDIALFSRSSMDSSEILKEEMESAKMIHGIGGAVIAMGAVGSICAKLSHERWLTFMVLVCLAAAQLYLSKLTQEHSKTWNDNMEAGRALRFAGGEGAPDWHRLRGAFEDEWAMCGGGAYNSSRVLGSIRDVSGRAQQRKVWKTWVGHGLLESEAERRNITRQYAVFCPPQVLPNASLAVNGTNVMRASAAAAAAAAARSAQEDADAGAWLAEEVAHESAWLAEAADEGTWLDGATHHNADFARLINGYCLAPLGMTNPWEAVDRGCYDSHWWNASTSPVPPLALRSALLGEPEVAVNAKLLFCLCELSDDYRTILHEVDLALGDLARTFILLSWVPIGFLVYFSLCTRDRDEYFDPDLL